MVAEPVKSLTSCNEPQEYLFKVIVIGEMGCGKTSFIKRYVHQFFSQHYRSTIGVDFALKVIHWDPSTVVRLQLWDIAGQERFGNMTRVYYKESLGAFIVYDTLRESTFEAVLKWKKDLDSKVLLQDNTPVPCVLLANKCDQLSQADKLQQNGQQHQQLSSKDIDHFCKVNGFVQWFETSAKDNINVDEAAYCLISTMLENEKQYKQSMCTYTETADRILLTTNENGGAKQNGFLKKDSPNRCC